MSNRVVRSEAAVPFTSDDVESWIDPFQSAERDARRAGGEVVLLPDGTVEVRSAGTVVHGTVLPAERFAAPSVARRAQEACVVRELAARGTRWLACLATVDRARERGLAIPAAAPEGWYFRTARSQRHGDYLHAIVALLQETALYHVYLWAYVCHDSGRDTLVPLKAFLGRVPTLTHHGVHVYTTTDGVVLCLSAGPLGGLPRLDTALARAVQWQEGAGYAMRGRRFPYAS